MDLSGANYDGKGLIVGHIASAYSLHVRVGAANAGHTVWTHMTDPEGALRRDKHVVQQIPVAAYANPDAELALGPGAQISPEILLAEVDKCQDWRQEMGLEPMVLHIDPRAHVITRAHIAQEANSGLDARIGSTSTLAREGIGTAQAARVMRDADCVTAEQWLRRNGVGQAGGALSLTDVPALIDRRRTEGGVLLEGTQGTGLSLTTGFFPYVTSRNTTAAGLCADCGVGPTVVDRVVVVARTLPIRVANPDTGPGTSGPFYPDSQEIRWQDIGIDPAQERTTVTKKVRRVATFSAQQLREAVRINGATEVAITFADYLDSGIAGVRGLHTQLDAWPVVQRFLRGIDDMPVTMLGTSPDSVIDLVSNSVWV